MEAAKAALGESPHLVGGGQRRKSIVMRDGGPSERPRVIDLGRRDYAETWALQKRPRRASARPATWPTRCCWSSTRTSSRSGAAAPRAHNVLSDDMPVVEIERGGDVTYHGPGQLVGYPIVQLDGRGARPARLPARSRGGAHPRCAATSASTAGRRDGLTGVWLGERKVASIGIAVRRWVTLHGFALNVSTDLSRFAAINPCGLDAAGDDLAERGARARRSR